MSSEQELNPYQAPTAPMEGAVPAGQMPEGFENLQTVVALLSVLLLLQAGLGAINMSAAMVLTVLTVGDEYSPAQDAFVKASELAISGDLGLFYLTLVPFSLFLFRANKNATLLLGRSFGYTPASMLWWFVVPIASWFKPYQAVRAVWDASQPADGSDDGHSILGVWWTAWLLSIVGERLLSLMMAQTADTVTHNVMATLSGAITTFAATTAWMLVRGLHKRQTRAAHLAVAPSALRAPP